MLPLPTLKLNPMKYTVLFCSTVLLFSCSKPKVSNEAQSLAPADCSKSLTSSAGYYDLPNIVPSFLISADIDESVPGTDKDTMEIMLHDRTYIKYEGQGYLLVVDDALRKYKEGDKMYHVAVFDKDCKLMCHAEVHPAKYMEGGVWKQQKQTFKVIKDNSTVLPPFDKRYELYEYYRPW